MKIEIGKVYMTANGRFVKIRNEPWSGVYNSEVMEDGREGDECPRYLENGICQDYLMYQKEPIKNPEMDIIMEDCPEAREKALVMQLQRKLDAYNNTK